MISWLLAVIGIFLVIASLNYVQTITGNVIGVNFTSRYMGIIGIIAMIAAIVIARYEKK